jgi:hypothetical protein
MFEVHIEGVLSKPDLVLAIEAVLTAFDDVGHGVAVGELRCMRADHDSGFRCDLIAAPVPTSHLAPCPRRGFHLRLTECWACWSDVVRGSALETDVLAQPPSQERIGPPEPGNCSHTPKVDE